jgi:hypothetical protein
MTRPTTSLLNCRLLATISSLVLGFQLGCAHKFRPTPTSDEFTKGYIGAIEKRAPHDMNCPAEQLTYKDIANYTVGVDGCNNRATYILVMGVGWVMNSAGGGAAAPTAPPSTAPQTP